MATKVLEHMFRLSGALLLNLCIGLCIGVTISQLWFWDIPGFMQHNVMPQEIRTLMLPAMLQVAIISMVVFLLLHTGVGWLLRRYRKIPMIQTFQAGNRYTFAVLAIPMFLSFNVERLAGNHPLRVLVISSAIAAIAAVYTYSIRFKPTFRFGLKPMHATIISVAIVSVAAIWFVSTIFEYQLIHHRSLKTGNYDMGVYINTLWNSAHGNLMKCDIIRGGYHILAHFDPILLLLSPLMYVYPHGETVLFLQTAWLAAGVVPLYLIVRHHLRQNWMAIVICFAYLLYPTIHCMALYEFHSVVLAGALILWAYYFIETRKLTSYFIVLVLLLLNREDLALIMFFFGFYLFYGEKLLKTGVITMLVCVVYYILVKLLIMAVGESYSYDYYFHRIRMSGRSLVESVWITLLTNPVYLFRQALMEHKLVYLLQLLVPLSLLPLLGRKRLFAPLYGILVSFFVSRYAVTNIHYQYSTFLYPFFFAMTPAVLREIMDSRLPAHWGLQANRLVVSLVIAILVASVCVSYNYGVFRENRSFRAGHTRFDRHMSDREIQRYEVVKKLHQMIPDSATLSASESLGPHFATRENLTRLYYLQQTDYYLVYNEDLKVDEEVGEQYNVFLRDMNYDLIFNEMGVTLFIRSDLNRGAYRVLNKPQK
jgi:uncharacterized membrane protein